MESNYFWWIEALAGVACLFGLQFGVKKIISRMGKNKGESWRLRTLKIFQPPLSVLIWSLLSLYVLDVCGQHFGFDIALEYLGALRKTSIIACTTWLCFRWKKEIEESLIADPVKKVDITTVRMVGRLASLGLTLITGLVILQLFGVNTAPLLAFGSIGAASIGFAGKDVMANFCSGIMLQISRPFIQGDQIFLPEKHLEGHIEDIGWFRTSIRDTEKRAVYLPNNYFSTMLVVNASRMTHKRLKQTLKLPLDAIGKIPHVVPNIREAITQYSTIDGRLPIHVYLKTFGDYACEIEIEAYSTIIDNEEFNKFQQEILLKIQSLLAEKEIPFAVPTMSWKQTF
jgi:MscS family membrane protein